MITGIYRIFNSPFLRLIPLKFRSRLFVYSFPKMFLCWLLFLFCSTGCRTVKPVYSFGKSPAEFTAPNNFSAPPEQEGAPDKAARKKPEKVLKSGKKVKKAIHPAILGKTQKLISGAHSFQPKIRLKPPLSGKTPAPLFSPARANTSSVHKSGNNFPADGALPDLTDLLVVLLFVIGLILAFYLAVKLIILFGNLLVLGGPVAVGGLLLGIFLTVVFFYYRRKAKNS